MEEIKRWKLQRILCKIQLKSNMIMIHNPQFLGFGWFAEDDYTICWFSIFLEIENFNFAFDLFLIGIVNKLKANEKEFYVTIS